MRDFYMYTIVNFADGTEEQHSAIYRGMPEVFTEIEKYITGYKGTSFVFTVVPREEDRPL